MKFITGLSDLEGKTIAKAVSVDMDESIVLIFTDKTCAYFDVDFFGDSHDMVLADDAKDYLKRDAGIISNEEYEGIQTQQKAKREKQAEQQERAELARLKEKYEA